MVCGLLPARGAALGTVGTHSLLILRLGIPAQSLRSVSQPAIGNTIQLGHSFTGFEPFYVWGHTEAVLG